MVVCPYAIQLTVYRWADRDLKDYMYELDDLVHEKLGSSYKHKDSKDYPELGYIDTTETDLYENEYQVQHKHVPDINIPNTDTYD